MPSKAAKRVRVALSPGADKRTSPAPQSLAPLPTAADMPPDAARLRVERPNPYVYRSRLKRAAAAALDAAGDAFLARRPEVVDWTRVRRVAVLRLDHLGDLVLTLPALRRLKLALPHAALDLWVGPWGKDLAELFTDVDAVHVTPAPWFKRPQREAWPWASIGSLAKGLRAGNYDAAFELRGDLRHHLALWLSGIGVRAGQAVTAGRFLLSHPVRWMPGVHEQDQSLSLMDQAGVPAVGHSQNHSQSRGRKNNSGGYLSLPESARREAAALCRSLKLGASPVLVQAGGGAPSRLWTPESWAAVLQGLPRSVPVALLGSEEERGDMQAIAARVKRPVALAAGRLKMATLAALLGQARLVLSVNSGPAHLAAIQGTPVLVVFSAANEAARWATRGQGVRVLAARDFPCSPCELTVCPYDNACMRAVGPDSVLLEARRMLAAGRTGTKGKP
jgi:ADP-heptose:LPS heptosyltransferase